MSTSYSPRRGSKQNTSAGSVGEVQLAEALPQDACSNTVGNKSRLRANNFGLVLHDADTIP